MDGVDDVLLDSFWDYAMQNLSGPEYLDSFRLDPGLDYDSDNRFDDGLGG